MSEEIGFRCTHLSQKIYRVERTHDLHDMVSSADIGLAMRRVLCGYEDKSFVFRSITLVKTLYVNVSATFLAPFFSAV